jgi:hypothetical protein
MAKPMRAKRLAWVFTATARSHRTGAAARAGATTGPGVAATGIATCVATPPVLPRVLSSARHCCASWHCPGSLSGSCDTGSRGRGRVRPHSARPVQSARIAPPVPHRTAQSGQNENPGLPPTGKNAPESHPGPRKARYCRASFAQPNAP